MSLVGTFVMAALGMGGGMIGGLLAFRLGLVEKFPYALWGARVLFGWIWVQIGRRLWANFLTAIKEP